MGSFRTKFDKSEAKTLNLRHMSYFNHMFNFNHMTYSLPIFSEVVDKIHNEQDICLTLIAKFVAKISNDQLDDKFNAEFVVKISSEIEVVANFSNDLNWLKFWKKLA